MFIDASTLKRLYSLNRLFLDVSLNERYSRVAIQLIGKASTSQWLEHLRSPHISKRVKGVQLIIADRCLYDEMTSRRVIKDEWDQYSPWRNQPATRWVQKSFRYPLTKWKTNRIGRRLVDTMSVFEHLIELSIENMWPFTPSLLGATTSQITDVIHNVWTKVAPRLQSINITGHAECFGMSLRPDLVLPKLHSASFFMWRNTEGMNDWELRQIHTKLTSSFIQRHAHQLRRLNLTIQDRDVPFLFDSPGVAFLPHLETFNLRVAHSWSSPMAENLLNPIGAFLRQHQPSLQHVYLNLGVMAAYPWMITALYVDTFLVGPFLTQNVHCFSNLASLTIYPTDLSPIAHLIPLLRRLKSTLKELRVINAALIYPHVYDILAIFWRSPTTEGVSLKHLGIRVARLDTRLFVLLARARMQDVNLQYYCFDCDPEGPEVEEDRAYLAWEYHLTLVPESITDEKKTDEVGQWCRRWLPNVSITYSESM